MSTEEPEVDENPPTEFDAMYTDEWATHNVGATVSNVGSPTSGIKGTLQPDWGSYPHCPVFVLSKGRAEIQRGTVANLVRDLIPCTVVVEAEEEEAYNRMLDDLVYQCFGVAGMVDGASREESQLSAPQGEEAVGGSSGGASKPILCGCCQPLDKSGANANSSAALEAVRSAARRIAHLYHHGYDYVPEGGRKGQDDNNRSNFKRRPDEAFVLHSVNEIREKLFRVVVLPESNKGVSYVRNYILHVLVPELMVDSGMDRYGHLEETEMFSEGEIKHMRASIQNSASGSDGLKGSKLILSEAMAATMRQVAPAAEQEEAADGTSTAGGVLKAIEKREMAALTLSQMTTRAIPHGLMGMYWVFDDDVFYFNHAVDASAVGSPNSAVAAGCSSNVNNNNNNNSSSSSGNRKNVCISTREMMREVERRMIKLRRNAPKNANANNHMTNMSGSIFTCAQDALINNVSYPPMSPVSGTATNNNNNNTSGSSNGTLDLDTFTDFNKTACYSLEYSRFAYSYDDVAIALNSYNNIACLFNYALLHNPACPSYFPASSPGVRSPQEVLVGYAGQHMLWYRFAVREDYDFTLQLIARGMCTMRFRNLSFDVPQMAKLRGGMTDYYRNCQDDMDRADDRFVQQWPAVAQRWVKGRNTTSERRDIRVSWRLLHPSRARHPGAYLYLSSPLPGLQPQPRSGDGGDDDDDNDDNMDRLQGTTTATAPTAATTGSAAAPPASRPVKVPLGQLKSGVALVGEKRPRADEGGSPL